MKLEEISIAMEVIERIVKDSLESTNPTVIANNLIKLAAWKFRFGELVAESVKMSQEAENQMTYLFSTKFLEARNNIRSIEGKIKVYTEEDSKSFAEIEAKDAKENFTSNIWYKTRVLNFWRDLESLMDAIKYKQRAIEGDYKNLQFGHLTEDN